MIAAVQAEMAKGFEGMAKSIEALTSHTQQLQQAQQQPVNPTPQQVSATPTVYLCLDTPNSLSARRQIQGRMR